MTSSRAAALRTAPERIFRSMFLWLSGRRSLGRLSTRLPITRRMVRRFVAGETLEEALGVLQRLRDAGLRSTVDVLGESVTSAAAASEAADRYLRALDALASRGLDANVSLKLSQMGLNLDSSLCRANVIRIAQRAREVGAFVRIDMESHLATDATLALFREVRSVHPAIGVVIQAALRRSGTDVATLISEGARVRLCKGAYREPASVAFPLKADVDAAYADLMQELLRNGAYPALATHDERLIRQAVEQARREGIGPQRFEFQMLYGVRRDLQERLVAEGWTVRVYVPFGTEWYPYFMRRLAERPANVGFVLRSVLRER